MFLSNEEKLLRNPPAGFPLIAAASGGSGCSSCHHKNVNKMKILKTAVTAYRRDPRFIAHCKTLFGLPTRVAGVLIEDTK